MSLTSQIKEFALDIGYSKVGIIPADSFPEYAADLQRRQEMYSFYLKSPSRPLAAAEPLSLMPEARSIITTVYDYAQKNFPQELSGKIGRIYQARCYDAPPERINGARPELLKSFLRKLGCQVGEKISLPERLVAAKAGIVTYGRNNFAYAEGSGSFIYLTSFVVDKELEYDQPSVEVGCPEGCSACMKACPTKAIYEPLKLDPRRCIAFNTFMTQERIAGSRIEPEIRAKMGTKVHGCDICQEVCPRNQAKLKSRRPDDEFLVKVAQDFSLTRMLNPTEEFYATRIQPLMYNYIREKKYFQRNAAIALGNLGDPTNIPALALAMNDPEELVRAYAAWGLGKIGGGKAQQILEGKIKGETSAAVKQEIRESLLATG
ncbi:4Fe-4S double cluster binding domain-containing protein [Desulfosporosinus sp. PR]|uniref:epoxyqueuosine reductase n=1 Tax=Candidatus Desulfosporosinus nitrosoreducens TaxID=3401928 RepID=UPI0027EEA160|nr:4Fe-4S double cluster binding domain-containing protein [Desulfosporosinus sp. PR]MDQ7095106.1 4Fe-4S double cluster binding domain-containing protein [Desulfosporosinus sp. PR]